MMLIENVTDQKNDNRQVTMTHTVENRIGRSVTHTIRIYRPRPSAGPLAGELIACYVLTQEQAMELKAHL